MTRNEFPWLGDHYYHIRVLTGLLRLELGILFKVFDMYFMSLIKVARIWIFIPIFSNISRVKLDIFRTQANI